MAKPGSKDLERALRNRAAGSTRIVGVTVRQGEDSNGETALFVELMLSNPPRDAGTWPVDDLWQLRAIVRDAVERLEVSDAPWFIEFEPEEAEEFGDEDTGEQLET
jgi:hypothetical protein